MAVSGRSRPCPLPGSWTFWADTIIGHQPLGPVTCTAFTAQRILSGFGTGAVTVPSGNTTLPPDVLLSLYSWRLWAFYNAQPVWCGIPTGLADQAAGTVSLTLTELPGYLAKRVFDVVGGKTYTQVEQTQIAADLAAPLADVGVTVTVDPGPGYPRDAAFEFLGGTDRSQLLGTFVQQLDAPEFRAEYYMDSGGRPRCRFKIAYPRVGSATGLGLTVPGNAVDYTGTWDTDNFRTRTYVTGAVPTDAAAGTQAPVIMVDWPQAGVPRLDAVDDYQDLSVTSILIARAVTAATQYMVPVVSLTGTVPAKLPALGTYGPGDDVTVNVSDPLLPGGLLTTARLTEMDIDAAAETVALTVAASMPAPRPRQTLAARLGAGNLQMARMTHRNLAAPTSAGSDAAPGGNP